jgi:dipeptidase
MPRPSLLVLPLALAGAAAALLVPRPAQACTSIGVTRGASADGSTMATYAADSHELYGALYHHPAAVHAPGATRKIIDWDKGAPLGEIPEAPRTYSVVGNMNEHQLVIGETTFGGREELVDPNGGLDYGSLIYLALQRSRTAREAVRVITELAAKHGYRSKGESLTLADPRELWLMEIVGRGPGVKGALWVARKVPEGMVTAHANMARIRTFPLRDPDTLYSPDVIAFAREKGWFTGPDEKFSFADAFGPPESGDLRTCELRVWRVFDRLAPSLKLRGDFSKKAGVYSPLPLWIKPDRPVKAQDLMALMRDHFEGTEFDLTEGVGAGPSRCPTAGAR